MLGTYQSYKSFPLTLDIVEDSPVDALAYLVVMLRKASHEPQLSADSLQGHFLVDNDVDETQKESIAFELFKHQTKPEAYVVEFRRANNASCSFFTLLKEYKEIYKIYYGKEYPGK